MAPPDPGQRVVRLFRLLFLFCASLEMRMAFRGVAPHPEITVSVADKSPGQQDHDHGWTRHRPWTVAKLWPIRFEDDLKELDFNQRTLFVGEN